MRLDQWLDIACLYKTRSEAQKACKAGKVDVNGDAAKPNRVLKIGDEIEISRPLGRRQRLVVRGIAERHIQKSLARELYDDVTPPPTPQEIEIREMTRLARPFVRPQGGSPDKRERRALRRLKGRS